MYVKCFGFGVHCVEVFLRRYNLHCLNVLLDDCSLGGEYSPDKAIDERLSQYDANRKVLDYSKPGAHR